MPLRRSATRSPKVPARWIHSAADERAVAEGCWFDERAASAPVFFFERFLRHSKGQWAGQPFALLDWQRDEIVMPLFGWMRRTAQGAVARRFREAAVMIPKKNGKSTLCAGLALYLLEADGEPSSEVYGAAADRDQAGIIYREAAAMVGASPQLDERLTRVESRKRIAAPITHSWYQALSADAFRAEGINAHAVIFDELHAQPDRRLYDALKYAGAARRQPLNIYISTAGEDKEHSICGEVWSYAEGVRDGRIHDTRLLPYIRAADLADDWQSPATWAKANPSLGITIQTEDMAAQVAEAEAKPALRASFRRYRLNQWAEGGEDPWLDLHAWDATADPTLAPEALEGRLCLLGLDHSDTLDLTALVAWFPDDPAQPDGAGAQIEWFWCPEQRIRDRARHDKVPYDLWAAEGHLIATPGDVVDYQLIWKHIDWLHRTYQPASLRVDPWNATATLNHCAAQGWQAVKFRQGEQSMNEPSKQYESAIIQRLIRHRPNPCMRWMIAGVRAKESSTGNIRPVKPPRRSRQRIDGVVAAIMARALPDEHERGRMEPASSGVMFL